MAKEKVIYTEDNIHKLSEVFDNMGEKNNGLITSKRAVVKLLIDRILQMQQRGYTFNEIAELLTKNGIEISSSTLKQYVYDAMEKMKLKKGRKRNSITKSHNDKAANISSTEATSTTSKSDQEVLGDPNPPKFKFQ
jgi:hypothetical protein